MFGSARSLHLSPRLPRSSPVVALCVVAGLLLSALVAERAQAKPPNKPKITDIADAFLVDSPDPGKGKGQPWFCVKPRNTKKGKKHRTPFTKCTVGSYTAAARLIFGYATVLQQTQGAGPYRQVPNDSVPAFMRVSKARDNCVQGHPDGCATGVPAPTTNCPLFSEYDKKTNPYCALQYFSQTAKIRLGVVISASNGRTSKANDPRPVRDIAYQACQIEKADSSTLFSFVFLDFSRLLPLRQRRKVVNLVQRGQVLKRNGKPRSCRSGAKTGFPMMTNDQNYERVGARQLGTNAWAHAKDLQVLRKPNLQKQLNDKDPLEPSDHRFTRDVRNQDSQAVLRFEVTKQTGQLAKAPLGTQCNLLGALGRAQGSAFSLIFPIFVHGSIGNGNDNPPYDSLSADSQWSPNSTYTFGLQSKLLSMYPGSTSAPPKACP